MSLDTLTIGLVIGGALLYFARRIYRSLRTRHVVESEATCGCGRGPAVVRARLQN